MAAATIITSAYDKRQVRYVDQARLAHVGVVVGQSVDGNWLYVQSTNPKAPPQEWHFKVAATMIDGVLV